MRQRRRRYLVQRAQGRDSGLLGAGRRGQDGTGARHIWRGAGGKRRDPAGRQAGADPVSPGRHQPRHRPDPRGSQKPGRLPGHGHQVEYFVQPGAPAFPLHSRGHPPGSHRRGEVPRPAQDQDAEPGPAGQEPERRQPAEGGAGEVAGRGVQGADLRRADTRHRRRRKTGDLQPDVRTGQRRHRHHHDLVRHGGTARHVRPGHRPVRRAASPAKCRGPSSARISYSTWRRGNIDFWFEGWCYECGHNHFAWSARQCLCVAEEVCHLVGVARSDRAVRRDRPQFCHAQQLPSSCCARSRSPPSARWASPL